MRPWIHRLVQQLSLPLGLTDHPSPKAPAPARAWTARPAVAAAAVPGVSCPPAISRQRAPGTSTTSAVPPSRPSAVAAPGVPGGTARRAGTSARRALRLHLDPRHGARAVMSGRCADVCAMLERLAAQEAAACHAG